MIADRRDFELAGWEIPIRFFTAIYLGTTEDGDRRTGRGSMEVQGCLIGISCLMDRGDDGAVTSSMLKRQTQRSYG